MKRLICLFLVLCLLAMLPLMAVAAELDVRTNGEEKTTVVTSYRTGNSLFSFICFDGGIPSADTVTLLSPNEDRFKVSSLESCGQDHDVRLMLLIDNSSSMKNYRDTLMIFAKELMEKGPKKLSVTVATQSKEYSLLADNVTEWEDLEGILRSISYDNWTSNPSGGVANALSYFDMDTHSNGEMLNLLVFTDGAGYFSDNAGTNRYYIGENLKRAVTAIAEHPQVLIHSVIVDNSITEETRLFEGTNGIHLRRSEDRMTEEDADTLAEYLNGIYAAKVIDINIGNLPLEDLCFTYKTLEGLDYVLHNVPLGLVADLSESEHASQSPLEPDPDAKPESQIPGEDISAQELPADEIGIEEAPQDPDVPDPGDSTDPSEDVSDKGETEQALLDGEEAAGKTAVPVWILLAIVAIIAVAAMVITIIFIRKRRSGGIAMQLTVEYGRVSNLKEWYYLKDSLFIGSGKNCDVVVPSSIVAKAYADISGKRTNLCGGLGGQRWYTPWWHEDSCSQPASQW